MGLGRAQAAIITQILAAGAPIPAAFINAAEPADDEQVLWTAFWELASTRPYRGAPIGWDTVHLWATSHDFDPLAEAELAAVVRALDHRYLEHWRREDERKRPKP